jgi:hypothetical protein
LVQLNNTKVDGKPVPSYEGQRWVTAGQANEGKMYRYNTSDDGKTWTKSPLIEFDAVPVYRLQYPDDTRSIAINGLNKKGDRLSITGMFGICNDRTYQFGQFSQRIGIYIAIGIVVIAIIFVMLDHGIGRAHGASFENPELVGVSSSREKESGGDELAKMGVVK